MLVSFEAVPKVGESPILPTDPGVTGTGGAASVYGGTPSDDGTRGAEEIRCPRPPPGSPSVYVRAVVPI